MQNQSDQVHGKVTEPLPAWSRIYGGAKFQDLMSKGYQITEETKRTADEAAARCLGSEEMPRAAVASLISPEPAAEKPKAKRAPRKKKETQEPVEAEKKAEAKEPVVEAAISAAVISEAPKPKAKRAAAPKKAAPTAALAAAVPTPIAVVKPVAAPSELTVVEIRVRRIEIDGRTFLLSSEKDKVYDLKYNYVGRYDRANDKVVSSYPDSEDD